MSAAESQASIAVIGAGSWGTALAIQFARGGKSTRLWGRDAHHLRAMARARRNERYLPEAHFPESLSVVSGVAEALDGALDVLIAVPSGALRSVLREIAPRLAPGMRLAIASKGFELATSQLPHEVAHQELGAGRSIAVLSGPTFAHEVGAGLPSAMTIASPDTTFATALAHDLSVGNFRAYTSPDIIGVEVGGAVKNVLAVAAGFSDGLNFGANTRVAIIARGLVEMTRLGVALGAQRETFMGLAGLGDLVLTCTDNQSRNRRFGLLLAQGKTPEAALKEIGQIVEGYVAARATYEVARRLSVDMPLSAAVYQVLYEQAPAIEVVRGLMNRPIKPETD